MSKALLFPEINPHYGQEKLTLALRTTGSKTFTVGPYLNLEKPETITGYEFARNLSQESFEAGLRFGMVNASVQVSQFKSDVPEGHVTIDKKELDELRWKAKRSDLASTTFIGHGGIERPRFVFRRRPTVGWSLHDEKYNVKMGYTHSTFSAAREASFTLIRDKLEGEKPFGTGPTKTDVPAVPDNWGPIGILII